RNAPAACSSVSRERASRSSGSLPAHASLRKVSRFSGGCCNAACSSLSSCFHCSESIARPTAEFTIQPELGVAPVAPHRGRGHSEQFGRLLNTESAKKAHLDDLHLAGIETAQRVHRIVERDKIHTWVTGSTAAHDGDVVQGDVPHTSSALYVVAPSEVDQY